MRNPFARLVHRDDTKPTLRERAASLKVSASSVIRARRPAADHPASGNPVEVHPDAELLAAAERARPLVAKDSALHAEFSRLDDLTTRLAIQRLGARPDPHTAWDETRAYDAKVAPIREESGRNAAYDAWNSNSTAIWELLGPFVDKPAKTLEGVAAKSILGEMDLWDGDELVCELAGLFYHTPIAAPSLIAPFPSKPDMAQGPSAVPLPAASPEFVSAPLVPGDGEQHAINRSPAPALAAMVDEWLRLRAVLNSDLEDEAANPLHQRWIELQLAIYRFPAVTLADLQAKVPVFRDELGVAEDFSEDTSRDLPSTAWRGVLADIERLSGKGGPAPSQNVQSFATADPDLLEAMPEPSAVAACIDTATISLKDLRALHDVSSLVGDVCGAMQCQPRCQRGYGDMQHPPTPAGGLVGWVYELCDHVIGACVEEAKGRPLVEEYDAEARLGILAMSAIENGDADETAAFVRDLQAAM